VSISKLAEDVLNGSGPGPHIRGIQMKKKGPKPTTKGAYDENYVAKRVLARNVGMALTVTSQANDKDGCA
jgi:hypothetical protein